MNTAPIKSRSQLAQQLNELLSRYLNLKLAILFGSQANPKQRTRFDSDIDLAILSTEPLSTPFKMQFIEAISIELDRSADIVDLHHAPEPKLGEVFKNQRLSGNSTTCAQLLSRHLLNTADFTPLQQRILKERRERWIE